MGLTEVSGQPGIETVAEYAKRWLTDRDGRVESIATTEAG